MPREFSRKRRVSEQIQRELAQLIHRELSDPRVALTTVSEVRLSRDMAYADVLVTRLGAQCEESQQTVAALNRAARHLRSLLGQSLRLRAVPALRFHYDESFERSGRVSRLIDAAVAEDKARHRD
ncbi:MAG: 30S ribosome-binding factor RbfA [Nitrococcus mobilis]|nr:30S ribosome-binding factor RbfA [Nitrococcus mobilis]